MRHWSGALPADEEAGLEARGPADYFWRPVIMGRSMVLPIAA